MTWVKRFAESVKRAGSDVAEDHAEGCQGQGDDWLGSVVARVAFVLFKDGYD